MATAQGSSTGLSSCKRCKSNVVNAIKCKNCENNYHFSCAKLCTNVKFVNNSEIICCEVLPVNESDNGLFEALEELNSEKKVDVYLFSYVIKQKDLIIQELRDKIDLLHRQMQLLEMVNQQKTNIEGQQTDKVKSNSNIKTPIDKNRRDKNSDVPNKNTVTNNSLKINKQGNSLITKDEVALNIMKVETENKLNKYINLTKEEESNSHVTHMTSNSSQRDEWKVVTKTRRKRQVIVGNNKESISVKGVPKLATLHVYRVDKSTTSDELTVLLKNNFQEVTCEKIISKHPEFYSSFKVTILEADFKNAMDPKVWPYGACISRFLDLKKKVAV